MTVSDTARPLPARVRRDRMFDLIRDRGFVRVVEISAMFGVSEVTVRADLDFLAQRGDVGRFHGGATLRPPRHQERPFEETEGSFANEKAVIAAAAAALVENGNSVILDVGTTTTAVARALVARADLRDVLVFTNALNIALDLEPFADRFTLIVLGGTLRPLQHSLVDPFGGVILEKIYTDLLFLGCSGVDPKRGITNVNLSEAEVKRRMLRAARRRVVVADGSKIGVAELARLCDIDDVDLLITDESADPETLASLYDRGLAVHLAEGEN